tara:strand:- start:68 stop:1120 length:1053 start_codon:yes stop_codon:yes gene_type:complete
MYKRGNTYWCKFRYNGKVIQKSLDTGNINLARKIEAKIRTQVAEGKYFEKSIGNKKTVSNMMEKFMLVHAPTVSESMQISYKCSKKKLISFFGDLKLPYITPDVVLEYKLKRRSDGVKPATINCELAMLSKALNVAVNEWQWLKYSPKIKREKVNNARKRWLSESEEERFQKACLDLEYDWLDDILIFDINTGLRMGELISLKWPEVNLRRKTIFIKETKNKEPRTVPLNQIAFECLCRKSKIRRINTKLVFLNYASKKWDKCNLGKIFRKVLKKAKIKDFRFHDLRHTFGSRLAQAGVDINTIARLMGHKDLKMTQRYIHHTVDSLRVGVDKLENVGYNLATMKKKRMF